jgi:PhoPQ-activated pathogenicity-related protein
MIRTLCASACLIATLCVGTAFSKESKTASALDTYVAAADDSYQWRLESRRDGDDATIIVLELTSQTWRKEGEVDRPTWKHWMTLTIPEGVTTDVAMLLIGGGRNGQPAPANPSERATKAAMATKSIVVELGQVPNQPLEFGGDGKGRSEDDLVARSMMECLKSGDPTWLAQLPMTKSAVRAMDAAQEAVKEYGFPEIKRFVVAGASKRGWTTWLTAAVDSRVAAIAPVVIDVLNVQRSMQNHHDAYGFWAQSLDDYENQGLTTFVNSPVATVLFGMVDPYTFRERLTVPKCVINATGDQFFTPDSSKFYFDDLPGEKLLCYVPNADHSLDGTDALDTLIAFHASIVNDLPRPKVSWELQTGGGWAVTSEPAPKRVLQWTATNDTARDFRVMTIDKTFTSTELTADASGHFVASGVKPEKGWAASFVQLEFDVGAPTPLRVTTPVSITPDTLPFAEASKEPAEGAAAGAR